MVHLLVMLVGLVLGQTAPAGTGAYKPLGEWIEPRQTAYRQWDSARAVFAERGLRAEARPQLAGLRPRSLELLQDALLRKHPRLLKNSAANARMLIARRYQSGLPQLRGIMAEALFLDRNPEWGYVAKSNASQHDVYRWMPGRPTPVTGQIKVHSSGSSAAYARDMGADYRAHQFFVPDDLVEPLKAYLKGQAEALSAAGELNKARAPWRNHERVRGLGTTYREINTATRESNRSAVAERASGYVTLGASLALSVGPIAWDWASGNVHANQAMYRLTRAGTVLGAGIGTDALLVSIKGGALRGTIRGNAIVGTAATAVEIAWQIYERGWRRSFRTPDFYQTVVGGIGGTAAGLTAGTMAAAATSEFGPWVSCPAGLLAGTVAGSVAYFGGRSATHAILQIVAPAMLRQYADGQIQVARDGLLSRIREIQLWPPAITRAN